MIGGDDDALACMIFTCMKALGSLILAWLFDVRCKFGSECWSVLVLRMKSSTSTLHLLLLSFSPDSKAASALHAQSTPQLTEQILMPSI
jgi:hypothetical protein